MYDKLLSPFVVGRLTLKNRMIMAPMATGYGTWYGAVTSKLIEYHKTRAEGGVALNMVEFSSITRDGRMFPRVLGIFEDSLIEGFKGLVCAIHDSGGKAALQIGHGGRRVPYHLTGVRPIGPSPIPSIGGETPRELSQRDIKGLQEAFVAAALRAKSAGFDAIELNMCHGYLVHQFLSPLANKRTDGYGGDLGGRARFATEIVHQVKNALSNNLPVICRISAEDKIEGGITLEEGVQIAKLLEISGADAIHVSAGMLETFELVVPPMSLKRGCYGHMAEAIKKEVKIPVIAIGRINTPVVAEEILSTGKADLIGLGRPLIADPQFPKKVMEKRTHEIRPCIACNQGCIKRLYEGLDISCMVNPFAGIESNFQMERCKNPKRVFVIGGGPAGMECACMAAARGHSVTLFEEKSDLGGRFTVAGKMPYRDEITKYISYMKMVLQDLKVEILLNKKFTLEDHPEKADVIVMATGMQYYTPDIQGLDLIDFLYADEVPEKKERIGKQVLILGGGEIGCEIAEFLATEGRKVTILEASSEVAPRMEPRTKKLLLRRLSAMGVEIVNNAKVSAVDESRVFFQLGNVPNIIANIDNVIVATGYLPRPLELSSAGSSIVMDLSMAKDALEAIQIGCRFGLQI